MTKTTTDSASSQEDSFIAETDRLLIHKLSLEDYPFILELVNSDSWLRYIGNRNIKTRLAARSYLEEGPLKSYAQFGFGLYKLILKETNKPIGICGLIKRKELELPDLGYALLEGFHGNGYVTESSQLMLERAQKTHKMDKLMAIVDSDNVKSIAVLEKLGFIYQHNRSQKLKDNSRLYLKTFI